MLEKSGVCVCPLAIVSKFGGLAAGRELVPARAPATSASELVAGAGVAWGSVRYWIGGALLGEQLVAGTLCH